ncbi:MAG: hypothetical protein RLP09_04330 [Sandaracinaceae bacterium]
MIRFAVESPAPLDPLQQLAFTVGEHPHLLDVLEAVADHHADAHLQNTFTGNHRPNHGAPRLTARSRAALFVLKHRPDLWRRYLARAELARANTSTEAN